jgi:uncharacterized iron-regulated membrane protein
MTRTLLKIHTWMALFAFIPLLVICLTGSILVFKHEIDSLVMPDKVRVDSEGQTRQSLDTLLATVNEKVDNHEVVGWVLFQDPGRADLVYVVEYGSSDWSYLLLNQYTGQILAPIRGTTHYLTDWLLDLHYTFLLDHPGLIITSVFSIILCALGLTGVFIYRKFWKNFFTLRWDKRLTVFYTDLHKMTGIITTPIFLILGFTGAYWNLTHFYHEEFEHADEEHHVMQSRLYNDQLSLQQLHDDSQQRVEGFTPTYFLMPYEPGINITFWGEVPTANFLASEYSSTVTYDAQTGEYMSAQDIREGSLWAKTEDSFRELHFGTFAGLGSKILWCIAGIAPLALSISGLYVWYSRRKKRRTAKAKRRGQQAAEALT